MKINPLLVISVIFAASFSGRAVNFANAASRAVEKPHAASAAPTPLVSDEAVAEKSDMAMDKSKPAAPKARPYMETEAPQVAMEAVAPPSAMTMHSDDEPPLDLLAAIRARAAMLDAREKKLVDRERMLEIVEKRVDQKTVEFKALKDELESRLAYADTAVESDISQLARMYESMKPQKAGEIFNAMESSFAAGFLTQMNSDSAALILANMDTDKAYATSIMIAGRNAAVNRP